jgi:predicted glycoside hydrolase/deacetylase ChbG (UPF0249 family)
MKLVIKADDVGYTNVCNIGAFETLDNGVVTTADVMMDTPGTVDALERLRSYPWISVGWHPHFWGSPVLGANNVPTMFDRGRNGFRKDLQSAADVSFEEALAECRAQIKRCVEILGRVPDVGAYPNVDSPFARAIKQVHEEYGIVTNFMGVDFPGAIYKSEGKWVDRKIFMRGLWTSVKALKAEPLSSIGWTDSISALNKYDPIKFYTDDESNLLDVKDDSITVHAWHPGYVDYYVARLGNYTPPRDLFIQIRTVDAHALCSQEVKDWIKKNKIELINFRDALYGTSEYQNHLRAIGSDLAVI